MNSNTKFNFEFDTLLNSLGLLLTEKISNQILIFEISPQVDNEAYVVQSRLIRIVRGLGRACIAAKFQYS